MKHSLLKKTPEDVCFICHIYLMASECLKYLVTTAMHFLLWKSPLNYDCES